MNNIIDKLISESRTYLGVPWIHQGRSRKGVDCVGFILLSFAKLNIPIVEIKGYSRHPDGTKLKEVMDNQKSTRPLLPNEEIKPGDVVLFKIRKEPQHVALVTDSSTYDLGIIHSYNGGMKEVIEHDFAEYWKKKIIAVYRVREEWLH